MYIRVYLSLNITIKLKGKMLSVRSMGKAMENMIPTGIRGKFMVFWRRSRCDVQSSCAEQARMMVKLIVHDIEKYYDCTENNFHCKIPIISKECRDLIKVLLDKCGDNEASQDCFLTRHNCNALALLTIDEALSQVEVGMSSAHEISMKGKVMKVLEGLQTNLRDNYSPTIVDTPLISAKLELKKLQYTGQGMEYLKLLSKNNELRSKSSSRGQREGDFQTYT